MPISYLIIFQLSLFLVAAMAVIWVQWRMKKQEILALLEQIDSLMGLLAEQQSHNNDREQQEQQLLQQVNEVEQQLAKGAFNPSTLIQQELDHLQAHFETEKHALLAMLKEGDIDQQVLRRELETLMAKQERAKEIIENFRANQKQLRHESNQLKLKLRSISGDLTRLNSLRVSRDRLERDQRQLSARIKVLEEDYRQEQLLTQNLKKELSTRFRAEDMDMLHQELKQAEDQLQRTLAEKEFIEQHFLELSEQEPEKMQEELERKRREISLLENAILEMDQPTT